jgi:hypothetical protein
VFINCIATGCLNLLPNCCSFDEVSSYCLPNSAVVANYASYVPVENNGHASPLLSPSKGCQSSAEHCEIAHSAIRSYTSIALSGPAILLELKLCATFVLHDWYYMFDNVRSRLSSQSNILFAYTFQNLLLLASL